MPNALDKEDALLARQKEAKEKGEATYQASPLEMPTSMLKEEGKLMPVEAIVAELLRAAGAAVCLGKAPRGNMARKLRKK